MPFLIPTYPSANCQGYSSFKLSVNSMVEDALLCFPQPLNFLHATALQLIRLSLICTNLKLRDSMSRCGSNYIAVTQR